MQNEEQRGVFSAKQVETLLRPIKVNRVLSDGKGHSHVSQQDVQAHLIRMFGFGNFDIEVLQNELIFEEEARTAGRFNVCYRALVRLTVRNEHGEKVASYENGSTATAQNQTRGDAHDLAYKSAISLSIKRAAISLGDQFGLSLYNKGQIEALVIASIVNGYEGDIQDQVPQQVSLGNDEVEHEDDAVRPAEAPAARRGTRSAAAPNPDAQAATAGLQQALNTAGA